MGVSVRPSVVFFAPTSSMSASDGFSSVMNTPVMAMPSMSSGTALIHTSVAVGVTGSGAAGAQPTSASAAMATATSENPRLVAEVEFFNSIPLFGVFYVT